MEPPAMPSLFPPEDTRSREVAPAFTLHRIACSSGANTDLGQLEVSPDDGGGKSLLKVIYTVILF
jgi:hypothetical protein